VGIAHIPSGVVCLFSDIVKETAQVREMSMHRGYLCEEFEAFVVVSKRKETGWISEGRKFAAADLNP